VGSGGVTSAWAKSWGSAWGAAWGAIAKAQQPTGGGGSTRGGYRYRVRVGRKWLTVDPLDARSVRAAYDAAQEAAEEAAERPAAAPRRPVVVKPATQPAKALEGPQVDYRALAAEARRISEQIRAVYADAVQRETIARLMREEFERDDEEALVLLLS